MHEKWRRAKILDRLLTSVEKAFTTYIYEEVNPDKNNLPKEVNAFRQLSYILQDISTFFERIDIIYSQLRVSITNKEASLPVGNLREVRESWQDSLGSFQKSLQLLTDFSSRLDTAEALQLFGYILYNRQRYENALDIFNRVLTTDPEYIEAYYYRGLIFHNTKQHGQAISNFDRCIQLDPAYTPAYLAKGSTLRELSHYEEALNIFEQVIQLDPNLAEEANLNKDEIRQLLQEQLVTYEILLTGIPDPIPVGGKLEVSIYLSQASSTTGNDSAYQLQIPRSDAVNGELNLFLTAPSFQFENDNVSCLPLGILVDDPSSSSTGPQVARFNLVPLRPGPARITIELYRGSTFETTLQTEVQVSPLSMREVPQVPFAAHPRPVLYPDLLLQVGTEWSKTDKTCRLHYMLNSLRSSFLPPVTLDCYSASLVADWIKQAQGLLQDVLKDVVGCSPEDSRTRLISLGQYLYHSLLPLELRQELRRLALLRQPLTMLILADQDAWLPWELFHDGEAFLGERFTMGRWLRELSKTCPYEFPVGAIDVAHYANVVPSMIEEWSDLLQPRGAPPVAILPGGIFDNLNLLEEMRGLYLLHVDQSDSADAPLRYTPGDGSNPVEHNLQSAKLTVRRNRPLVNLGYIRKDQPELTALEQTWATAFIRAGCSAFVGSLWAVDQSVEAAFVSGFYQHLWAGDSLGGAFKAGCLFAQLANPESLDYLAYTLYGDPMARPYRPIKGHGYAILEPIGWDIDKPVQPGATVRCRASLRRTPPIWHEDRVIEIAETLTFDNLQAHVVTFDVQLTPSSSITLSRTSKGDYLGWFSLTIPPEMAEKEVLIQVHFADGRKPIHSLTFTLKVGSKGGGQ